MEEQLSMQDEERGGKFYLQVMSKPKINKKEFNNLFQKGKKIYREYFVVYYTDYYSDVIRVAIKKKVGNSVKRNYHKRFFREMINFLKKQHLVANEQTGNKLVLIVILKEIDLSFEEAIQKFTNTFRTIYR